MTPNNRLSDAELNAYVDGELSMQDRQVVEKRLSEDPRELARLAEYRQVNEAIRVRFAGVLDEPLPQTMHALIAGTRAGGIWQSPLANIAAALLLVLAGSSGGYLLRGLMGPMPAIPASIVTDAAGAHSVYVSEVRHPVEVGASEADHLVKWLTKRVGADIRAPDLKSLGFELLGGRLLPFEGRPAAQFMYQNGDGKRVTLYIRRTHDTENTAFKFGEAEGLSAFYWIDRPLAYAIVGELDRGTLEKVAHSTYEQLN